jgi:predicted transcriptional regulator
MKAGLVSSFRDGRYTRYFQSGKFEEREMKIVSLLRHETAPKVLSLVSKKQALSHIDLASKLGISSQALTWHMNRLKKNGLISFVMEGRKMRYSLDEDNAEMIKFYLDFIR